MASGTFHSPLRYPGGKAVLADFFKSVIEVNNIQNGVYCEAYCGGAGAALTLLFDKSVDRIILNDADYHIFCFWNAILENTDELIERINEVSITVEEWRHQKLVYENYNDFEAIDVAFSTFFLNRCNRAGIIPKAGPIGGINQESIYTIDVRFNKTNLIERIKRISKHRESISLHNLDAIAFLNDIIRPLPIDQTLIYLDPPYFEQGRNLYLSFYQEDDHAKIAIFLQDYNHTNWVVSYDNVEAIRNLYARNQRFSFNLNYSLQKVRKGKELMVFSDHIVLPDNFTLRKLTEPLICF